MRKVCIFLSIVITIFILNITFVYSQESTISPTNTSEVTPSPGWVLREFVSGAYQEGDILLMADVAVISFGMETIERYERPDLAWDYMYNLYYWEEGQTIDDKVLASTYFGNTFSLTLCIEELKPSTKYYFYLEIGGMESEVVSFTTPATLTATNVYISTDHLICGDTNNDGVCNIIDALRIAQYYTGIDFPDFAIGAADVNQSGSIDIVDSLLIAQFYVGVIPQLDCVSTN